MNLPDYIWIETAVAWQDCLLRLQAEPRLAIDLEANSMYAYQEQVCLIQISIPDQDYIIDPTAVIDLEELGELIADPAVEKVFHAAEYDLMMIQRDYGWRLNNLFDTMWAARILGIRKYGLANLLGQFFGVKLNKKYQRSNWCKRPLSDAQLRYAQLDTHYLLRLREQLKSDLEADGRWPEAQEIFTEQTAVVPSDISFSPDSFWSINGVRDMTPTQQAVLKALNIYRDQEAERKNRPHFKVFSNKTLIELATKMPRQMAELPQIYGMSGGQIRRYGHKLLQVIRQAQHDPPPRPPQNNNRPPDAVLHRYDRLHRWRKKRARARGVESDVIVSRDALWELAWKNPQTTADLADLAILGPWRFQEYSADIVQLLQRNKRR